ncbi:hypothetical protein [Streptomyces graminofaciens]|uniref:hypothetical protein n=1 Tax=Streptomyces graminofaciens TaxID=68212 RepID=UPI00257394FB|nr:hypothetical protein [Streptomyces graminofaciens]
MAAVLVAGAAVVSLAGCEDKDDAQGSGSDTGVEIGRNGGTTGGGLPGQLTTRQKLMLDNLPESDSVMAAGEYLQRFTTCERYSIDPADTRYYPMDEEFDESWGVRFRGTCGDGGNGYIRVFWTGTDEGMKQFQEAYRDDIAERVKTSPSAGIDGGFGIGRNFAVIAPGSDTLRDLSSSHLLVLNCNPNFEATGDVSTAPAEVDGCVLTDDFID